MTTLANRRSNRRNAGRRAGRASRRAERPNSRRRSESYRDDDYDDESREERARRRKRAREKKLRRQKRMAWTIFAILFAIFIICYMINAGNKKKADEAALSANMPTGLPQAGVAAQAGDYTTQYGDHNIADVSSNIAAGGGMPVDYYAGATEISQAMEPNAPVNALGGRAAVNLDSVSGNTTAKISAGKTAMARYAYFTGTTSTVGEYLSEYGAGEWHGIQDTSGEYIIFYEGNKRVNEVFSVNSELSENQVVNIVPFKITFQLYEDGTFRVLEAEENNQKINDDDLQNYMEQIVGF